MLNNVRKQAICLLLASMVVSACPVHVMAEDGTEVSASPDTAVSAEPTADATAEPAMTVTASGLADGYQLEIAPITDETQLSSIQTFLDGRTVVKAMDISPVSADVENPGAGVEVTVTFRADEKPNADDLGTCGLYHLIGYTLASNDTDTVSPSSEELNVNASYEKLGYTYDADAGTLTFTTSSFSPFVLAEMKADELADSDEQLLDVSEAKSAVLTEEASDSYTVSVQDFSASFVDGADLSDDGTLTWNAEVSSAEHGLMYQVNFRTEGTGIIPAGAMNITIPKQLIKNRAGEYDDLYEMSYPLDTADGLTDDNQFVYKEDGDHLVIYNRRDIGASMNDSFQIIYKTSEETFQYVDNSQTDAFTANLSIGDTTASAGAPAVTINTSAVISSLSVPNMPTRYTEWQSDWGEAPSDADDYIYLDWIVRSFIDNPTQTYALDLSAETTDGKIVGYKYDGETAFTAEHTLAEQTGDYKYGRYDHILTRLDKAAYGPDGSKHAYTVHLKPTVTVTPRDGADEATTAHASGRYYYEHPYFRGEGGRFWVIEYGRDSRNVGPDNGYKGGVYDSEAVRVFGDAVNPFIDGDSATLGTFRYRAGIYGYGGDHTVKTGEDKTNPANYWRQPVRYEITNEQLYYGIGDDYTAQHTLMDPADYDFKSLDVSLTVQNAFFNEKDQQFHTSDSNFSDGDVIHIYAKKESAADYALVASYVPSTNTWSDIHADYVTSASGGHLDFTAGVKGYRVDADSAHYYTELNVYPEVILYSTDAIKTYVTANKYRFAVRNRIFTKLIDTNTNDTIAEYKADDDDHSMLSRLEGADYGTVQTTVSDLTKIMESYHNDTISRAVTVNWDVVFKENYASTGNGVVQNSGRFYDLLPEGADYVPDSVAIYADGKQLASTDVTVTVDDNWRGSERTMLIVSFAKSATAYEMTYQSMSSWDALRDYGRQLRNTAAYETGNEFVGDGYPDDGTASAGTANHPASQRITEMQLMADLDDSESVYAADGTKRNKFVYVEKLSPNIQIALTASLGLYKKVKSGMESGYKKTASVRAGNTYTYKIRFGTDSNTSASNLIIYDALEQYTKPSKNIASDWRGTLQSIGMASLKKLGADPVVYYSTTVKDVSGETDALDSADWSTEKPADASTITAIAIDARRKSDGSDFVMDPNNAVEVYLYMKAPLEDASSSSDPTAYNDIYLYSTAKTRTSEPYTSMQHEEYTSMKLRVMGDVKVAKVKEGTTDTFVPNVEFSLTGTSAYGTKVDLTQKSSANGLLVFRNIEKGDYILQESRTTSDWFINTNRYQVHIDGSGNVTIDGLEQSNGCYLVGNEPRVHGDLMIKKTDTLTGKRRLKGAEFRLSGTSAYGTVVLMYAKTDSIGTLTFSDVEMGSYTLTETAAPEGYILNPSDSTWSAVCDAAGNFTVSRDDAPIETDGSYAKIANEPAHSFTIMKIPSVRYSSDDPTVLEGATFELKGTSDYGTAIDLSETTAENGLLTFGGLEPGVYALKETKAPDGYHERDDIWPVVVKSDDTVTIEGLHADEAGIWTVVDAKSADDKVVITKKWNDGLTGEAAANRAYPNLVIESYNKDEKLNIPVTLLFVGSTEDTDVTVKLLRNGEKAATAVMNESNFKTVFTDQPKYDASGSEYVYTVETSAASGDDVSVSGSTSAFTVKVASHLAENQKIAAIAMEKASAAYTAYVKEHGSISANAISRYKTVTYTYFLDADDGIINFRYTTDNRWIQDGSGSASTSIDPLAWSATDKLADGIPIGKTMARVWTIHMNVKTGKIERIYMAFPGPTDAIYLKVVAAIKSGDVSAYQR